jgi:F-type H+-transporting ATPase subunit delta
MSLVARRYAKAIFALAREEQSLEATAADLERLAAATRDPYIGATLANPLLSPATRRGVARTLAEQLQLQRTTRNFLCLLADKRRLDHLQSICDHYRNLIDDALKQVRAEITTATPLTPAQSRQIVESFERLTAKRVLPTVLIDPGILGGLVVAIEGKVYDGSLRSQLSGLAGAIAGTRSSL